MAKRREVMGYIVYPSVNADRKAVYLSPEQMDRALSASLTRNRKDGVNLPDPTTAA